MRIINAAKKTDEIVATCATCHSVLGVREVDVKWYSSSWSYVCPVCCATNYFDIENKLELFPWIMEDKNEIQSDNSVRKHEVQGGL